MAENIKTHQDRLLWLAEQEVDCPIYHSNNIEPTCTHITPHCLTCVCGGTGKVPRFPMLREECSTFEGVPIEDWRDHERCDLCWGRGWVFVDSTDATLEALATEGFFVKFIKRIRKMWETTLYQNPSWLPWGDGGEGDTPNEAAVETLYRIVERKEELE